MASPATQPRPANETTEPRLKPVPDDPAQLTEAAWEAQGCALALDYRRSTDDALWAIGDWIVAAEQQLDGNNKNKRTHRYTKAAEITDLGYGRLRNVACTARAFDLSRRRYKLSF